MVVLRVAVQFSIIDLDADNAHLVPQRTQFRPKLKRLSANYRCQLRGKLGMVWKHFYLCIISCFDQALN